MSISQKNIPFGWVEFIEDRKTVYFDMGYNYGDIQYGQEMYTFSTNMNVFIKINLEKLKDVKSINGFVLKVPVSVYEFNNIDNGKTITPKNFEYSKIYVAKMFNDNIGFNDFEGTINRSKFNSIVKSEVNIREDEVTQFWITTVKEHKALELNFEVTKEIIDKISNNESSITFRVDLRVVNTDNESIPNTTLIAVKDMSINPDDTIIMSLKNEVNSNVMRNELYCGLIEEMNYKTGETNFVIPTISSSGINSMFSLSGYVSDKSNSNLFGDSTNINTNFKIYELNNNVIIVENYLNQKLYYFRKRNEQEHVNYQKGIESNIKKVDTTYLIMENKFVYTLLKSGNNYRLSKISDKYSEDETTINWDTQNNQFSIYNGYGDQLIINTVKDSAGQKKINKIIDIKNNLEMKYEYTEGNERIKKIKLYNSSLSEANEEYMRYIDEVTLTWVQLGGKYYIQEIRGGSGETIKYNYEYSHEINTYKAVRKTINNGLIVYQDFLYQQDKTTITDSYLGSKTLYFDSMSQLTNIRDNQNNYTQTYYNFLHHDREGKATYAEKRVTNNVAKNYIVNADFSSVDCQNRPKDFDLQDFEDEDKIVTNGFGFVELVGQKLFYISNVIEDKVKTMSQVVLVDNVHKETTYLLSFWYFGISPNDLSLTINDKVINYTIVQYQNLFKHVTATFTVDKYTDNIHLKFAYSGKQNNLIYGAYFGGLRLTKVYGSNYKFDNNGQIINVDDEKIEYDEKNNIKSMETKTEKLNFEYNNKNRLQLIYDEKSNYRVVYEYDNQNNVICEHYTDKKGKTSTVKSSYKAPANQLESVVYPNGFKTRYFYDEHGRLSSQTDESGLSYHQLYDYTNKVMSSRFELNNLEEKVDYVYNLDALENMCCNDISSYAYARDKHRRLTQVSVDQHVIRSFNYDKLINGNQTDLVTQMKYPDDKIEHFEYNDKGELLSITFDGIVKSTYTYDEHGRLIGTNDLENTNHKIMKYYDIDTLNEFLNHTFNNTLDSRYSYDSNKKLISKITTINDEKFSYYFKDFTFENEIKRQDFVYYKGISGPDNPAPVIRSSYKDDKLIQYKIASVYNILEKNYTYNDDLKTRSLTEDYGTYKVIYTFDEVGHITHIVKLNHHNDIITACYYEYDAFKRLSKETTYDSSNILVSSMSYKYDNRGNIIEVYNDVKHEKLEYQYHEQIKNRLDKVLKYSDGTVIDYVTYNYKSNVFNPDSYHKNNHEYPLQWEGSKLIGHGQSTYTYDEAGIRIKKEAPTGDITYITENNKVVRSIRNDVALTYHYDSNDRLVGFRRHDKEYFYDRDITGNILSIIDSHGNNMVNYAYTAYGIPSKSINENLQGEFINEALSIMEENIFLYKGYIYDYDTNMYYCMSRYYDPEIGRWLSIDDVGYLDSRSVHGLNLYAYCRNNPVMYIDRDGKSATWILGVLAVWLLFNLKSDDPNTMVNYAEEQVNQGKYFRTHADAANSWKFGALNQTGGDGLERSAMIYAMNYGGRTYYRIGLSYKGYPRTVINGFLFGYLLETPFNALFAGGRLAGYMHTHPNGSGTGASNADRLMLYLPGIEHSYIFTAGRNSTYYDQKNPNVDFWEALRRAIFNGHGSA